MNIEQNLIIDVKMNKTIVDKMDNITYFSFTSHIKNIINDCIEWKNPKIEIMLDSDIDLIIDPDLIPYIKPVDIIHMINLILQFESENVNDVNTYSRIDNIIDKTLQVLLDEHIRIDGIKSTLITLTQNIY